jgi:serine/threonine protein kinase
MSVPSTPVTFVAPEPEHLAPFFPGYKIEFLIATGGMGAVYRAVQKSLDRHVAIKILPREFGKDENFRIGFEAEAKAMARLNHPNLIGVYDFGEVEDMLYIIMEYVHGQSLHHAAHGIALDPGEVIRLVTGICNGLSHAHENGIIHRDIKPSNILLDLNAQPKIGDFGLARPIEHKIADGEEIYGTPHYTAPEVLGSPQSVGARADIFSVGVMLHELLTGRLPAKDRKPVSTIVRCDHRFDAIIRKATDPLPANRYGSAAEIAKDLGVIAASSVPKAARPAAAPKAPPKSPPRPVVPPPRTTPVRKTVRMRKKSSPLPGIIMLVIAIVIAAYGCVRFAGILESRQIPVKVSVPSTTESSTPRIIQEPPNRTSTPVPQRKYSESSLSRTDTRSETPRPSPSTPSPDITDKASAAPLTKSTLENSALGSAEPKPEEQHPKFDVPGFLEKANGIMREKCDPLVAKRDESLAKNIDDFGKALKRKLWRMDTGPVRTRTENSLELYIKYCRDHGNRIPEDIAKTTLTNHDVQNIENYASLLEEYTLKEKALDEALHKSLVQYSSTYTLGIEKQIERLSAAYDSAAIEELRAEIDKTRIDEKYFPDLMLGPTAGANTGLK